MKNKLTISAMAVSLMTEDRVAAALLRVLERIGDTRKRASGSCVAEHTEYMQVAGIVILAANTT